MSAQHVEAQEVDPAAEPEVDDRPIDGVVTVDESFTASTPETFEERSIGTDPVDDEAIIVDNEAIIVSDETASPWAAPESAAPVDDASADAESVADHPPEDEPVVGDAAYAPEEDLTGGEPLAPCRTGRGPSRSRWWSPNPYRSHLPAKPSRTRPSPRSSPRPPYHRWFPSPTTGRRPHRQPRPGYRSPRLTDTCPIDHGRSRGVDHRCVRLTGRPRYCERPLAGVAVHRRRPFRTGRSEADGRRPCERAGIACFGCHRPGFCRIVG